MSKSNTTSASVKINFVTARVGLNLRTGPSTDHNVIKVLPRGTMVEILEEGPWSRVRENGTVGFVSSNYLSEKKPGPLTNQGDSSSKPGRLQTGMNINPDAHGRDIEQLRGLGWVRLVYKADARQRSVDKAFTEQYQSLLQAYTSAGINCLLILNQETVWGNTPWYGGQHEDWKRYADSLAQAGKRIAELCHPFTTQIAYQIWNEEDSPPENPSAIGIPPHYFALVLERTAAAIRQVTSKSRIVIGGLNSGPENAVTYVRQVQAKLSGRLPVDALAYHPYGRYVHTDPFYNKQFGTLQTSLHVFKRAFPQLPLWITEIGVAADDPIGPENYEKIALYMREFVQELSANHTQYVPVLIWFAWSDLMRNAGITTVDGQLKPYIGDAFREMVAVGQREIA